MSLTRLILIPPHADEAAPWRVVDAAGHVHERGTASPEAPVEGARMRTVAFAPGAQVLTRRLILADGTLAQRRAAAVEMLTPELASPVERMKIALGAPQEDGGVWIAAAGDAWLSAWIDWLDAAGARPDVVLPDTLAITPPESEDELIAVRFGPTVGLRGRHLAVSVDPELAQLVAAGRTIVPVESEATVERMLIDAALNPTLDLLAATGRSESGGWRRWRLAAALAAGLLISPVVLDAAQAARDEAAAGSAKRQASQAAVRAFPDLAGADDPGDEAVRRLTTLPPGGVTVAAAALFAAVEGVAGAELEAFSAEADGGVRATVRYPAWQDLDAMKSAVAARGLRLTDTSTLEENGRIVSDLVLEAGR